MFQSFLGRFFTANMPEKDDYQPLLSCMLRNVKRIKHMYSKISILLPIKFACLFVFYVPLTAGSFTDGTPFTVPYKGREAHFLHCCH